MRRCEVCKSTLEKPEGRGRPSTYCDPEESGRRCREVAKHLRLAAEAFDETLDNAAGKRDSALYWYRTALSTMKSDVASGDR